jgi:ubiquinone/menaquinone biosynthesis C-methylase UbiE
MSDWVSYWDSDHPIYVNARHRDVHYRVIADDIAKHVRANGAVVLDYGCGEALHADTIAQRCRRLLLADAAPNLRATLAARFAGNDKISIVSPEDVDALPDQSVDLIVIHSVAQYLKPDEADHLFGLFRRVVKTQGRLIVGDVVPPNVSPLTDVTALLRFAAANGFLFAALRGLVRTVFSDYPRLRAALGFTLYEEADMIEKLKIAGFDASRAPRNLGHNQARMTFDAQSR